jgi:hypothetical protein
MSLMAQKLKDLEEEKSMVESDFQEKINNITKQLQSTAINTQPSQNESTPSQRYYEENNRSNGNPHSSAFSASEPTFDSPYAYNIPQDKSTGISTNKVKKPSSSANRGGGGGDPAMNLDLLALANLNDKYLQFNDSEPNPYQGMAVNNGRSWQMIDNHSAEMSRLGVDLNNQFNYPPPPAPSTYQNINNGAGSGVHPPNVPSHLMNVYPQTLAFRSPDDDEYNNIQYQQQQQRQQHQPHPTSAAAYLNNLQDQQEQLRSKQSQSGTRTISSNNSGSSQPPSNRGRNPSPSAIASTLSAIYDHPLRNALRAEVKSGAGASYVPGSFASAPSPYTAVRAKVSTTNYNHTINSKMKPTKAKTGTILNSRVNTPSAPSSFPRGDSPNRRQRLSSTGTVPPLVIENFQEVLRFGSNTAPKQQQQQQQLQQPQLYYNENGRAGSPSRFMGNTNSSKQKINNPTNIPDAIIRAANWKL